MISLYISPDIENHQFLLNRIEELSLKRKVYHSVAHEKPVLKENGQVYEGYENISEQLNKLDSFRKQWYACLCD